jgi:hypothetical protein
LEQLHPFCGEAVFKLGKAGNVATGPCQAFDEARADRVDDLYEHDWNGAGRLHQRRHNAGAGHQDDVGRERNQFRRISANLIGLTRGPLPNVDPSITAVARIAANLQDERIAFEQVLVSTCLGPLCAAIAIPRIE